MDKMREEFECWANGQGYNRDKYVADDCGDVYKHLVGQYVISETRLLWKAWQSSRAALCVELPRCWNDEQRDYRDELVDTLSINGIPHK